MKYFHLLLLLLLLLLLISCGRGRSETRDAFLDTIQTSFPKMEVVESRYLITPGLYQNTHMAIDSMGVLLVSDFERKAISLLDTNGTAISRFGREGRGPGEFLAIDELSIGPGHQLYVLDQTQYQISRFTVSRDGLFLRESKSYKDQDALNLTDLHITGSGRFGVFRRVDDWETWENSYHLYRLKEDFEPDVHLLEMPGYDVFKLEEGGYMMDYLSSETYWDFDRNHFFYTTSKSSIIHSYHLDSGEFGEFTYLDRASRPPTDSTRAYFRETWNEIFDMFPQMEHTLETMDHLPFVKRLVASGNYWFLEVFYTGGNAVIILVINRETGAIGYISVPRYFRSHGLIGNSLYGIDMDGEYRVLRLQLAFLPE